jgi:hypothetical protein
VTNALATRTPARGALSADLPVLRRENKLAEYDPSLRERGGNALYDLLRGMGMRSVASDARKTMETAIDFVPVVGDALAADDFKRAVNSGDSLSAILAGAGLAIGAVPVVGDVAGKVIKSKGDDAVKAGIRAVEMHPAAKAASMAHSPKMAARETGLTVAQVRAIRELQAQRYANKSFVDPLVSAKTKRPYMTTSALSKREMESAEFAAKRERDAAFQSRHDAYQQAVIEEREGARETMKAVAKEAQRQGMTVRSSTSKDGGISSYYAKAEQGPQIRISDHEIPWTDARESQAVMSGRNSYDGYNGPQITLSKPHSDGWVKRALLLAKNNRSVSGGVAATLGAGGIMLGGANDTQAGEFNGGGERNDVVFDDNLIDIVRKYGIAGALGLGIISQEMADQMRAQGMPEGES